MAIIRRYHGLPREQGVPLVNKPPNLIRRPLDSFHIHIDVRRPMGIVGGVLRADFDAVVPWAGTDHWGQRGVYPEGFDDGAPRYGGPAVVAAVDLNTGGHAPGFDALVEVGGAAEAPGEEDFADFELLDDLDVGGCLPDENEGFVD